jgi:hypothetical protein
MSEDGQHADNLTFFIAHWLPPNKSDDAQAPIATRTSVDVPGCGSVTRPGTRAGSIGCSGPGLSARVGLYRSVRHVSGLGWIDRIR